MKDNIWFRVPREVVPAAFRKDEKPNPNLLPTVGNCSAISTEGLARVNAGTITESTADQALDQR
jgi:hypothetical protein